MILLYHYKPERTIKTEEKGSQTIQSLQDPEWRNADISVATSFPSFKTPQTGLCFATNLNHQTLSEL